jgi:hypothetical protein
VLVVAVTARVGIIDSIRLVIVIIVVIIFVIIVVLGRVFLLFLLKVASKLASLPLLTAEASRSMRTATLLPFELGYSRHERLVLIVCLKVRLGAFLCARSQTNTKAQPSIDEIHPGQNIKHTNPQFHRASPLVLGRNCQTPQRMCPETLRRAEKQETTYFSMPM